MSDSKWRSVEDDPPPQSNKAVLTVMKYGYISGYYMGDGQFSGYYWQDMTWYASKWMPIPE